jgi:uncharacterized membrane protein YidH (DUF202 family)
MDETSARTTSHLTRLCRFLLGGGAVALALAAFLQWDQVRGGESRLRNLGDTYAIALIAQLLTVVGTVALTGAVFGYVLLAVRRDREQSSIEGQAPDASWSE